MFTPKSLIIRFLGKALFLGFVAVSPCTALRAEDPASYAAYFDAEKSFRPAQTRLDLVLLQMAASFECLGTPEPYVRHVIAEHARIDAKCEKATGKTSSSRPAYFTDDYAANLIRKWKQMAPILSLESLTRQSGANMRYALMGSWNMSVSELMALESKLTATERRTYRVLLGKDYFTKADFGTIEAFYKSSYDKLTEAGKNQLSRRTKLGEIPPEKRAAAMSEEKGGTILLALLIEHQKNTVAYLQDRTKPKANAETIQQILVSRLKLHSNEAISPQFPDIERDALYYSRLIRDSVRKRIDHVRSQVKHSEQAEGIENALMSMISDLAELAQSEYEAALREDVVDRKSKPN